MSPPFVVKLASCKERIWLWMLALYACPCPGRTTFQAVNTCAQGLVPSLQLQQSTKHF